MTETLRITIDQLAYSRIYLKSLRDAFFINYPILWTSFCQNTNVVFAKVTTQYCLLAMLEKWKPAVDKGKSFGALLTDRLMHLTVFHTNFMLVDLAFPH